MTSAENNKHFLVEKMLEEMINILDKNIPNITNQTLAEHQELGPFDVMINMRERLDDIKRQTDYQERMFGAKSKQIWHLLKDCEKAANNMISTDMVRDLFPNHKYIGNKDFSSEDINIMVETKDKLMQKFKQSQKTKWQKLEGIGKNTIKFGSKLSFLSKIKPSVIKAQKNSKSMER